MLAQVIIFLVLLWVVNRFAIRPVMNVANAREKYIKDQLAAADIANNEARILAEEQKEVLTKAKIEMHEILEKSRKEHEVVAANIIKTANEKAENLRKEAVEKIKLEKQKALQELQSQVGVLSQQLASKILNKNIEENKEQNVSKDVIN